MEERKLKFASPPFAITLLAGPRDGSATAPAPTLIRAASREKDGRSACFREPPLLVPSSWNLRTYAYPEYGSGLEHSEVTKEQDTSNFTRRDATRLRLACVEAVCEK